MFKVAVVGSGYIAQNHLAALKKLEGVELAALVARNPVTGPKSAEPYGIPCFSTMKEAVEKAGVNVMVITLPTYLHEQFVIEAAQLKCHVICEKPITFTLESFDRMTAACKENGVRFMVAQVARYWPEFMTIKDYIEEGKLGDIHMIYEKRICQHPTWATWHRDPKKSGGGLYDLNIHDIDYLYSIFGKPCSVYANGWKSPTGCWNHVVTSLIWESGVKATVDTCLEMTGNWPFSIEFRAEGDKGTIHYALTAGLNINEGVQGSNLTWYPAGEETVVPVEVPQTDMFESELREFFDAARENREPVITNAQVRGVLEIIQATVKSLEENVVVKL